MRLGAIIAGGRSSRFGSDKALAMLGGRALLDHVFDALAVQVDAIVVCGRKWPGVMCVADRPAPDLGPLGGLCGALHHAARNGFKNVVTVGCDTLPVPPDLVRLLGCGPATIEAQPLFGVWPSSLSARLDAHLAGQDDRSMRHWIAVSGARTVATTTAFSNFNRLEDLARYQREHP